MVEIINNHENTDIQFNTEQTLSLLESNHWAQLQPNLLRPDALFPNQLNKDMLQAILATLIDPSLLSQFLKHQHIPDVRLNHTASIHHLETTDRKAIFLLTTPDEKKLIIKLQNGYNFPEPLIPQDPKISPSFIKEELQGNTLYAEYNDPRTYLCSPFTLRDINHSLSMGIIFQEYAGSQYLNWLPQPIINGSIKRVTKYVEQAGLVCSDYHEFRHQRHYLLPHGRLKPPAIIDIPLKEPLSGSFKP